MCKTDAASPASYVLLLKHSIWDQLHVYITEAPGFRCTAQCRNMDVVGVPGVEAEAEVLSAITLLLQRLKLSAQEIVIKVSRVSPCSVPGVPYGASHAWELLHNSAQRHSPIV